MEENSFQLIKFCSTRTVPAAETKSMGLQANARVVMVFASHLDYFIVTQCLHASPGLGTVKPNYRDLKLFSHLPGPDSYWEAKNSAPRR